MASIRGTQASSNKETSGEFSLNLNLSTLAASVVDKTVACVYAMLSDPEVECP